MTEAKEYIERGAAINSLTEDNLVLNLDSVMDGLSNQIKRSAHRILASLPAADVVPVRHGRWINIDGDEESHRQCSECLQDFSYIDGLCYLVTGQRLPRYCPNCGARMDGPEPPKEEG